MRSPIFNFRRNAFIGALFAAVLLASCKKEPQQPESVWSIGTETFKSNSVEWYNDKPGMWASWKNESSTAGYSLGLHSLNDGRTYRLKTKESDYDPSYMDLYFSKGNVHYEALTDKAAQVTISNDTYTIMLEPTLFRQYDDTLKTVLISATLRYKEQ